jgi:multidrug transporter EmrE-like cation transporter
MQAFFTLTATVLLNMIAHSFMKMSSIRDSLMPYFFLGVFFFASSVFFYRASLKILPLNKAFLILNGSSYVLIGIISVFLFNEKFSVKLLMSYLLVVTGLVISIF